jgi:hypothetical protein
MHEAVFLAREIDSAIVTHILELPIITQEEASSPTVDLRARYRSLGRNPKRLGDARFIKAPKSLTIDCNIENAGRGTWPSVDPRVSMRRGID